jgi:cytokinesis protein
MSPDLCTEGFLSEMNSILPSPEQVGKLNVYRNADAEELGGLHPSDRLMVQLIKIERLGPRLQGMLYRCRFDEQMTLWEENARKLVEAGEALLHSVKFKELMSVSFQVLVSLDEIGSLLSS